MLPDLERQRGLPASCGLIGVDTPIVFLTAREATEDKVTGLTAGGDDYVTKPFSLEELVARIRAILRRTAAAEHNGNAEMSFEDLVIDEEAHEVWRQGQLVELTATEFNLLRYLLVEREAGRVQVGDPGQRVGLRLRRGPEHRRDLHLVPTQEDRQVLASTDPDRPGSRLQPAAGHETGS